MPPPYDRIGRSILPRAFLHHNLGFDGLLHGGVGRLLIVSSPFVDGIAAIVEVEAPGAPRLVLSKGNKANTKAHITIKRKAHVVVGGQVTHLGYVVRL